MHPTVYEIAVNKQREMFEELLILLRDNKKLHLTYVVNVIDDNGETRPLLSNTTAGGFTPTKGSVDFIEILTINVSAGACPSYGWVEGSMAFYFDLTLGGKPERVFVSPLAIASLYVADTDHKGQVYGMGRFADIAVMDRVNITEDVPDAHIHYHASKIDNAPSSLSDIGISTDTASDNVVPFNVKKH